MTIESYKKNYFIQPNLRQIGMSMYAVRTALLQAIKELKNEISGEVLDLGCGVMPYKEFLLESNRILNYTGIDLEPTIYHNQVKPDRFWDGITIPFEDNSFDWVIATEFFEHYFEMENLLKEIKRVLKKDGTLFFTVPFIWTLHEVPHDQYRFTPFYLERLFLKTGFFENHIKSLGGFNRSMATMLGLWLEHSYVKKAKKRFLKFLFTPFYHYLLKKDYIYKTFDNHQMPSGLYGFARVKKA